MDLGREAVDARIMAAFDAGNPSLSSSCSSELGSLASFDALFPSDWAPSLRSLAQLQRSSRNHTPSPFLKVTLGFGVSFVKVEDIYQFFYGLIHFESSIQFTTLMEVGHTVVITGGAYDGIAAAASFVIAEDGLFVDALAVSRGTNSNPCTFPLGMLEAVYQDQAQIDRLLMKNHKSPDLQNHGLGSFLVELLVRIAALRCTNAAVVYLRACSPGGAEYYKKRGFDNATWLGDELYKKVPSCHTAVDDKSVIMCRRCDRPVTTSVTDAAEVMAGLNTPRSSTDPRSPNKSSSQGLLEIHQDLLKAASSKGVPKVVAAVVAGPPARRKQVSAKSTGKFPPKKLFKLPAAADLKKDSKKTKHREKKSRSAAAPIAPPCDDHSCSHKVLASPKTNTPCKKPPPAVLPKPSSNDVTPNDDDDDDDDSSEEDSPSKTQLLKKSNKAKRKARRARNAATKNADRVQVASSDEEDAMADYDTYTPTDAPGCNWTLPVQDFWGPSEPAYKKFKALIPEASHQLSQKEINSKHGSDPIIKALGRLKVIKMARHYHKQQFTNQQCLDLAAAADLKRPLEVHGEDRIAIDGYKLGLDEVKVKVSSYQLPPNMTLERLEGDKRSRQGLKPAIHELVVSLPWLLATLRPEIAEWMQDTLQGTKVFRVRGFNACTDVMTLLFSGKSESDNSFVSLPQGHIPTRFGPVAPPSLPWSRPRKTNMTSGKAAPKPGAKAIQAGAYYDGHDVATPALSKCISKEAKACGLPFVAPPPKKDQQVVKLKWVPSVLNGKNPMKDGVWHGAHAVPLGIDGSNTVLQECGLLTDWVESVFAASLREECKKVACGRTGKRKATKFIFVPAGDVHDTADDPPPETEVLTRASTACLQGDKDTCLRDSLASALAAMGFFFESQIVTGDATLVGCTLDLVSKTVQAVRTAFAASNLRLKKLHNHACSVEDIARLESSWPIVLLLQTSDGCHGSHAVTTWNSMIFDSNYPHPLRWSQKSLDWCSGKDTACVGFSRAYRLCPDDHGVALPQSTLSVGSLVRSSQVESNALGWIRRLPSKKMLGYLVRYTNGVTKLMSAEDVAALSIASAKVGDA
jgi:hypothetical protein